MEPQADTHKRQKFISSRLFKCCVAFVFFLLSVLIVACGSSAGNTQANLTNPAVTVTINMGANTTPLPTPLPYSCGAWATNTSPAYNATSTVAVYAKYIHSVNGDPEGVNAASATATIHWGDNTTDQLTATTTSDGLVVFNFDATNQSNSVGKLTLVTVTFVKDGTPGCTIGTDRAAFFTLIVASPTASGTPGDNNNNNNNNNGNGNGKNGKNGKKKHG